MVRVGECLASENVEGATIQVSVALQVFQEESSPEESFGYRHLRLWQAFLELLAAHPRRAKEANAKERRDSV